MQQYLASTLLIDADHPKIQAFTNEMIAGIESPKAQAIALYLAVRDGWKYNPYRIDLRMDGLKASDLMDREHGYCVEKANLLAAGARVAGIPSRLGFAKVKNHIGTSRLEELLETDTLVFHGYTEFFLEDQWVKATPAFNKELCERFGVPALEFNGEEDSIFQPYSEDGSQFMEYLHDYGTFDDLPRELYISELEKHYPHLFQHQEYITDEFYFIR